jgi:uncharacterized protein (DUF2249 family)
MDSETMDYPIVESDIPIKSTKRETVWTGVAAKMNGGDSVWCVNDKEAHRLKRALRALGYESTTRKENGGRRVWRVDQEVRKKSAREQ